MERLRHIFQLSTLAVLLSACGSSVSPETNLNSENPEARIIIELGASNHYTGWLYSYGLEWLPCQPSASWALPSLVRTAHASHPITYDETGQWQWHQRILVGESQEFIFEGPLDNNRYCGIHWLFAHGGITVNGILSSFQIEQQYDVLATSHHAWALNIEFDQPLCGDAQMQLVKIDIPTQTWLEQTMTNSSATQNAREATLNLSDYVKVTSTPCE